MGGLVVWLFVSYSFVLGVGTALLSLGGTAFWVGLALWTLFPIWRVTRRFRPDVGYRLIGNSSQLGGNLGDRGGLATRMRTPLWFKLCLGAEVAVIAGLASLFFGAKLFS
ncbi:MAG TPA: hypothetical protein RMG48_08855 [Myxococcales bacterium LLY-WYZ-16_1]|jgi:hypothetical protein|nr:hypothetical protein [Myxococcales bacterium LLY-WYZ-16_1]